MTPVVLHSMKQLDWMNDILMTLQICGSREKGYEAIKI